MEKHFLKSVLIIGLLFFGACSSNRPQKNTPEPIIVYDDETVVEMAEESPVMEENELSMDAAQGVPNVADRIKKAKARREAALSSEKKEMLSPKDDKIRTENHNTEEYDKITENIFTTPAVSPLSTFSIDVDGAAYTNSRRFLEGGSLPPAGAVRIEEFINYFDYDYKEPTGEHPFSVMTEVASCPWKSENKLIHIGLQGKSVDYETVAPTNLTFLLDVSGSMSDENKLPLLKKSLKLLLENLQPNDKISIVVYAGAAGTVLAPTPVAQKEKIIAALDRLEAGGSTAGGEGIELAYKLAEENLIKGGNNRVILATDGDFNIGISSTDEMVRLIEEKRKTGIYLTICGLGMGNYKDGRMEQISNAGNGNYYYIDSYAEARKIFGTEMRGTLFTIAKDVKIQIEFNPAKVAAYRLVGYENRKLNDEDFNDDKKDAGELGAGHTVTAIYEIVPAGVDSEYLKSVDGLKYQKTTGNGNSDELMTVKLRYKRPDEDSSRLLSQVVKDSKTTYEKASADFRFSAAVAQFGLLLRKSEFKGKSSYESVIAMAQAAKGSDEEGYRSEFIRLVKIAGDLDKSGN